MSHEAEHPDQHGANAATEPEGELGRPPQPSSIESPASTSADVKRRGGRSSLVIAGAIGAVVALALVGSVWFVVHWRSNSDNAAVAGSSAPTMQQAMAQLGCQNPRPWESAPGIGTGYFCNGSSTDTVFFFESKQAQTSWLLRIQGTSSGKYLIVGSGWYVGTYSSDMAATAIAQGGQQVN